MESETKACIVGAVPRIAVTSASRPCCLRNPIPDATHKGAKPRTLEEAATGNLICSSARANTGKRNTKDATSPNRLNFIFSSFSHDRLHRNHKRKKGPGRSDSTTASQKCWDSAPATAAFIDRRYIELGLLRLGPLLTRETPN